MSPEENLPKDSDSDSPLGANEDRIEGDSPKSGEAASMDAPNPNHPEAAGSSDEPGVATAALNPAKNDVPDISEPVMAELANSHLTSASASPLGSQAVINPIYFPSVSAPSIAGNLENLSANGGAIGSLVLGVWCMIGSFITTWSIINGVIGLMMGFWGLTSRKQRVAWIGIIFCVLGIFMSLIQISELINMYLNAVDETPY